MYQPQQSGIINDTYLLLFIGLTSVQAVRRILQEDGEMRTIIFLLEQEEMEMNLCGEWGLGW